MVFPSGSVLVVDRAFMDYDWLYNLDSCGVHFVTRLNKNAEIEVVDSLLTDEKKDHFLSDEDIVLTGFYSNKVYSKSLRVVKVYDSVNGQALYLLTSQSNIRK